LFLLVILAGLSWTAARPEESKAKIELIFFDVGQGDSIYLEIDKNFQVLIDGGPDDAVLEKLGKEMPFYDKDIEMIVLTHPDSDHLFGLLEVLRNYNVKNVLWTGAEKETGDFLEWKKLIKEEKANIFLARPGQKIIFPEDIYFEIIRAGKDEKEINDTSIVGFLKAKDAILLLAGDISQKIEKQLAQDFDLKADILKIAHHGSKTSSCPEFIEEVSPSEAVISVGDNKWGHPAEEILQMLENLGINVLITKNLGDIKYNF